MARRRSSSSNYSKKSSCKKRYGIELLPEELIFKIFTLLPVITLLRCKSVCKSWLSTILNPKFIETHLIESQKRQPLSILKLTMYHFYIDTDHKTSSRLQLPEHLTVDAQSFLACCNGLVCLANPECDIIYLWNPMIRQFKILPTPPNNPSRFCYFMLGFGYDGFSNDYKVLRIVLNAAPTCRFYKIRDFEYLVHAWMYSANEDSWKEIEVPKNLRYCFKFYQPPGVGVFLPQTPGVLYFEGLYELLLFDLHDEVFRVHPYHIPGTYPIYAQNKPRMSNLLNFEGSLAMIYDESTDDSESLYSLWTLDVDCGNASWTKQFNLESNLKNDRVALYLGDGQFLVVKDNRQGFGINYYYYTKKHAKKYLPEPRGRSLYQVVKYNESLVSLKGFEQLK